MIREKCTNILISSRCVFRVSPVSSAAAGCRLSMHAISFLHLLIFHVSSLSVACIDVAEVLSCAALVRCGVECF